MIDHPSGNDLGIAHNARALAGIGQPALRIAKFLCEYSEWRLTNLSLQKILYLLEMAYLGKKGRSLIQEDFEAWAFGPVVPNVYERAKIFGSGPVENIFHAVRNLEPDTDEAEFLRSHLPELLDLTAGQLVTLTHWQGGAWSKTYRPGIHGLRIPKSLILEEYARRFGEEREQISHSTAG